MAEELTTQLVERAERGHPRGAEEVLDGARREAAGYGARRPALRSGPAIAAAAAVAVLAVGGAAVLTSRALDVGRTADSVPAATPPTTTVEITNPGGPVGAVFSWSTGDLGEWVTEEEVGIALAALGIEGVPVLQTQEYDEEGYTDYVWHIGTWRVFAHNGTHGKAEDPTASFGRTDSRLPEGVVYEAFSGFAHGFYGFKGPLSDESICIGMLPRLASLGYPGEAETTVHEERVFALASMMLRELGWVEDPGNFSWEAGDDIGRWVTEAEMTELLQGLAVTYSGGRFDGAARLIEHSDEGVTWSTGSGTTDPSAWSVTAMPVGGPYDDPDGTSPPLQGHSLLPAGVGFRSGWGAYGFFNAPRSAEPLLVILYPPEGVLDGRSPGYQTASLRVGAFLLREMGWAD